MAVALDVLMEECPACGGRWLRWEIAGRLDELFSEMLASDLEAEDIAESLRYAAPADVKFLLDEEPVTSDR